MARIWILTVLVVSIASTSRVALADFDDCIDSGNPPSQCALYQGDYDTCIAYGNSVKDCTLQHGDYDSCIAAGNSPQDCSLHH